MKILLVGSGGREHALALGLQADPSCTELHCAPGNPGIAEIATLHPVAATDNKAIVDLAKKLAVDLVVIGPEVPLVNGVADDLRAAGLAALPAKPKQKLKAHSMLSARLTLLKMMVLLQGKALLSQMIAPRR